MSDKRNYLAIFSLPVHEPEHLRIVEVIRSASGGDFKQSIVGTTMLFTFASATKPHALDFSRILMNADEVLFIELGAYAAATRFRALTGWLNSHGIR